MTRPKLAGLALAGTLLATLALAGPASAGAGSLLVVVAHPDDEALMAAGVIWRARTEGRGVYVAVVTNGDAERPGTASGYCEAADGIPARTAQYGLLRNGETLSAMRLLGLRWSANARESDIFFLGYPDGQLATIARSVTPWMEDATGLHRTYAEDGDGSTATCNGDLRHRLSGRHSELTADAIDADLDSLLALTRPSDIYTHAAIDSHPDHAQVYRQVVGAILRGGLSATVHAGLILPEGETSLGCSSAVWPNPPLQNNDPFARFTPALEFTEPPTPPCSAPTGASWGSWGPPNEVVEVPDDMKVTSEASNLKWLVISTYGSQIHCDPSTDGTYSPVCGFMRAFVKRHELFWKRTFEPAKPEVLTIRATVRVLPAERLFIRVKTQPEASIRIVVRDPRGRRVGDFTRQADADGDVVFPRLKLRGVRGAKSVQVTVVARADGQVARFVRKVRL